MRFLARIVTGEAGLGPAFAFLVAGVVAVSFAFSAGLFLAAKSDGASSASIHLLLYSPLVAGAIHSLLSASALWHASATKPRSIRAPTLAVAGIYCILQLAALTGGLFLAMEFGS